MISKQKGDKDWVRILLGITRIKERSGWKDVCEDANIGKIIQKVGTNPP